MQYQETLNYIDEALEVIGFSLAKDHTLLEAVDKLGRAKSQLEWGLHQENREMDSRIKEYILDSMRNMK